MHKYTTARCRPIVAGSFSEAAETFAGRLARRAYGRRAYARTLNCTGWAQDGSFREFEAFLGYRTGPHETTGSTERFTVSRS